MMLGYGFETLLAISLIFALSAFFHGGIGLGFAMLATPLLALFMDMKSAIVLTLIPTLLVNLMNTASEGHLWHALRRNYVLAFLTTLGSAFGTVLLLIVDSEAIKVVLAVTILLYLLVDRFKFKLAWIHEHPQTAKIHFGLAAGVLGGVANVMAPLLIIYFLEAKQSRSDFIQASNLCFMLGKLVQLIILSLHGDVTESTWWLSAVMLILVALALNLGIKLRRRLHADMYKNILRLFLLGLSISLLVRVAL